MSQSFSTITIICLVLITLTQGAIGFFQYQADERAQKLLASQDSSLQKLLAFQESSLRWEYTIESVPDLTFSQTMDALGKQGWELVFARRAQDSLSDKFSYECIFKRSVR